MLGFGRIQFANADGSLRPGLDAYREESEAGIWNIPQVRSAHEWFQGAFAVANIIPNVGGCLLRRGLLSDEEWKTASTFKILGDWFLYLTAARGGRIAYEPSAVSYFRQHGDNTSVRSFESEAYYREHERVMYLIRKIWAPSDERVIQFVGRVEAQYKRSEMSKSHEAFSTLCSEEKLLKAEKRWPHYVIGILAFHLGGGEIAPTEIANALVERGDCFVSLVVLFSENEQPGLRRRLDMRIPIYDGNLIREIGADKFLGNIGATVFNSHFIGLEYLFIVDAGQGDATPYIATLHGSYEGAEISAEALVKIIRRVDRWVYLTPKNLNHLLGLPLRENLFTQVKNSARLDSREYRGGRKGLSISDDAFIFTVVSRAIKEKGWRVAIKAFHRLRERTNKNIALIFCGSGPELLPLRQEFDEDPGIRFVGFQERVHGLYRISDCALLPTRFLGESFPLALIQAMQVGLPVVATKIGQIETMIRQGDRCAGVLVEFDDDDEIFVESLVDAMHIVIHHTQGFSADSFELGKRYDIDRTADEYVDIYNDVSASRMSSKSPDDHGVGAEFP